MYHADIVQHVIANLRDMADDLHGQSPEEALKSVRDMRRSFQFLEDVRVRRKDAKFLDLLGEFESEMFGRNNNVSGEVAE